jgi:hypothetical protein
VGVLNEADEWYAHFRDRRARARAAVRAIGRAGSRVRASTRDRS